jgi:predicted transglutaminase-like cysteine proteinase
MLRNCGLFAGVLLLAVAGTALGASPSPQTRAAHADAVGVTSVPYGWIDFCRRYGGECDSAPPPAIEPSFSPRQWQEIAQLNRSVNAAIQPVSDLEHWGFEDQWDYPTDGKGDCEDYALFKRKLLITAGYPRQALLMTVVRDEAGEGHAVLTLVSNQGDYILDNKTNAIRLWSATRYQFIKRQSPEDPNVWLSLRGNDVPSVATTR